LLTEPTNPRWEQELCS